MPFHLPFARGRVLALTLCCALLLPAAVLAQGAQTGTITGVLTSSDRMPLPGVTVTATSPNQPGASVAVSDGNGVYYLRGLLPGPYRVVLELAGFQTASHDGVEVTAGGLAVVDGALSLAAVTETVTVTAAAPPVLATPRTSQTYAKREVDLLPIGRRPFDVAELAPGVTTSVFNTSQLVLGGAFAFDNVFMVNGVDVNDNVFGTANNLFIEDAVQQTTVLTHGVPAEYGRFSGGVVNVVTRSGGNTFGGSFRESLSRPTWIARTPLERQSGVTHSDVLSSTHEGTFGGPLMRDRVWFFGAARYESANTPATFAQGGAGYTRTDTNRRGELKITAALAPSQTVQGSFIENATRQANASALPATRLLDAGLLTDRDLPNRLFGVSYAGVVGQSLFATAQYTEKKQGFRNNGGTSTELTDSPFMSLGATPGVAGGLFYNAPVLDAADPEDRNNRQLSASVARLLTTRGFGSHDLKAGGEYFVSTGIGGNSQSATGAIFATDYLAANGAVVRDASGAPIPVFVPGLTQMWMFEATRGAEIDITTTSFFAQDRWVATPRLTLDLGVRFEMVGAEATGGITPVDAHALLPRLGAAFDVLGDGTTLLTGTYSHYSGKYGQVQFGVNTNVGRPNEIDYVYSGPAGQGGDFAPGFDPANYTQVVSANFPTANVQVADGIRSPLTREFTVGLGREIGRGHARATYAWRRATGFVEDFVDLSRGTTTVAHVGTLTNRVYDNADDLWRDYQAVIVQSGYRLRADLVVDGHYTLQLRNHGTFAGEAASQPGIPSIVGNFPEIFGPALDRLNPEGRLDNYQQHKLRVFANYTRSLGRFGSLDLTPLWRVNSGGVYNLTATIPVPAAQLARNPGYPARDVSAATRETVFFGERGAHDLKGYGVLDFAATYNITVWQTLRPWLKVEVYNALNNAKQIGWDRTIAPDAAGAVDANGIPTGYVQGPRFGEATSTAHYVSPRAFRVAFGVRF